MKYRAELIEQENKLTSSLSRIYSSIRRDMNLELKAGRLTWNEIQRIYRKQTDDIIRSAVEEMYRLGAKKTAERDIRVPFFLTVTDRSQMNQLILRYQNWFWIGLSRELVNKTANAYDPKTLMMLKFKDIALKDTFLQRMAGSVTAEVTSTAVVAKSRQILLPPKNIQSSLRSVYRKAALEEQGAPQFIWTTTGDNNVCPICSELEGRSFEIDDQDIPIPIVDTHPNCGCELVLANAQDEQVYEGLEDIEGIEI